MFFIGKVLDTFVTSRIPEGVIFGVGTRHAMDSSLWIFTMISRLNCWSSMIQSQHGAQPISQCNVLVYTKILRMCCLNG